MKPLLISVSVVAAFAVLGNAFLGDALTVWYAQLDKPWYLVPLWFFIIVGILYYLMAAIILYRQLRKLAESKWRKHALVLTIAMLAGNELWNYLFFGLESTFFGFVGLIPFTALVCWLAWTLKKIDRFSFRILLLYILWLGYDLIWTFGLFMQNR